MKPEFAGVDNAAGLFEVPVQGGFAAFDLRQRVE